MSRRTVLSAIVLLAALLVPSNPAHARVNITIGINLPAPPPLVPVPGTVVTYAPGVPANYFFYGGQYWVFVNGGWYASGGYNGPWVFVAPAYIPRPLLAVPLRYYRLPPHRWRHWRRDAPPRWSRAWGKHWVEHPERGEHHERLRHEHGERHRRNHDEDER
jgi:hypothetical protein